MRSFGAMGGDEVFEPVARLLLAGGDLNNYRQLEAILASIEGAQFQLRWCEQLGDVDAELCAADYHLIIVDCCRRPEVSCSLLRRLAQQQAAPPMLALTDTLESPIIQRVMSLGAADFLAWKNLDGYILQRCIAYVLNKHEVERKLAELKLYDPLTGVPNRMLFLQNLARTLDSASRHQAPFVLLYIDLDGFKRINDYYGNDCGDQVVTTVVQRLSRCVRKSDGIARVGPDEFTLILEDCRNREDAALVAQKLVDVLSAPYTVAHQPVAISCSIGVALYPDAGQTAEQLLQAANIAMREAKRYRGSLFSFFTHEANVESMSRLRMEEDLRRAVENEEFELYYQPRVGLESGDIIGMEALIRWRHPERGLILPAEFIPIAEESGVIVAIGYWVIARVCQDLALFDNSSNKELDIAINLSFKQLQDENFVATVTRIIRQSGVDAHRLEFELTETAIMSSYQQTYEGMMALARLGVTFSLDDFGTGFSSFAHIQRLPISALKVDQSFVRDVVNNNEDSIIVKAMINLAHSLRLQVIAEGVETLDQIQFLWQSRCDQVQGFYFSPAVTAPDFVQMVDQRTTALI